MKSVLSWFLITFTCSLAILYFEFCTSINLTLDIWTKIYPLLSSLMIGLLTSFSFYFLVVFLPQKKKKTIIKSNFYNLYLNIKEEILREIIWAAQAGGYYDLHNDEETLRKLMNHKSFREVFDDSKKHNEGWSTFINGVTSENRHYSAIIDKFQILAKQIEYILLNYQIEEQDFFDFFKGLEIILLEAKSFNPNTDDLKPFCRFLWDIYAGSAFGEGIQDFDIIETNIRKF